MNLWSRWWRQPHRVWLRRATFQIHLWLGLVLGLYILMLSITGSILVYRIELDRWAATPTPAFEPERPLVSRDIVRAAATEAFPGWQITRQGERISRRAPAISVMLARDGEEVEQLFHPYTGEHLGVGFTDGQAAVLWLVGLHDDLLFDREGRWWNGIGSGFATVLVLTGLVTWWPGVSRWKRSVSVKLTGGWRRTTWDLHSAAGFYFFPFLLVWGVSGAYMGVPDPFLWLLEAVRPADGSETMGDTILVWMTRLHFGRWRIGWLKAVWAVLGLVPALMFITAVLMWWNRLVRPKFRSPVVVAVEAAGSRQ